MNPLLLNAAKAASLDATVAGWPSPPLEFFLFKNDFTPVKGSAFSAFEECDFPGYARVEATWQAAVLSGDVGQKQADDATFTADSSIVDPQPVYGWGLIDADDTVVFAQRDPRADLDPPVVYTMLSPNDQYRVVFVWTRESVE